MSQPLCFKCNRPLPFPPGARVPKSETCEHCDADVKVCKNCKHYDKASYNECHESQAERVVEKDRANYCDYFALQSKITTETQTPDKAAQSPQDLINARLKALLKD